MREPALPTTAGPGLRPATILAVLGVALLLGLLEAAQIYLGAVLQGTPVSIGFALNTLPTWLVLAAVAIPAVWLAQRFRLDGGLWRRHLPVHAIASFFFAAFHLAGAGLVRSIGPGLQDEFFRSFFFQIRFFFALDVITYWAIVGGVHAYAYYVAARDSALAASRLEARLAEARLQTLRGQLNPHFLFNTLNAISTLALKGDREHVVDTIGRLSDLLRFSLDDDLEQEIALDREMDFLSRYLDIVQTRFGSRLSIEKRIDPDLWNALVPSLFLQPLVENAIVHGISQKPGPGHVRITADRSGDSVVIAIHDDGPGLTAEPTRGSRIGLSNTRARLEQLYGTAASLTLTAGPDGGATTTVRIPFNAAGPERAASVTEPEHEKAES